MAIAYPFVDITIVGPPLPVMTRAPGVLAIVGEGTGNAVGANIATPVADAADAKAKFGATSALTNALTVAFNQDPAPSKIYGVKLSAGTEWVNGLGALEAADDVTVVALAGAPVTMAAADTNAGVVALKAHVENQSSAGNKRIGVAAIDPGFAKTSTYVGDVKAKTATLKAAAGRLVLVAARGATATGGGAGEVAAAAASAIAGLAPSSSVVLKRVGGFTMPLASQYGPQEIKDLATDGIIPVIDPALVSGEGLYFAEGTTYATDAGKYIDQVRLLDDIEFKLKASLILLVGDARITRSGLASVIRRIDGVLELERSAGAISEYSTIIPVYEALMKPAAARSAGEIKQITDARASRVVDLTVVIVAGPAIHRLSLTMRVEFA
jgi:hypothetical protein